MKHELVYTTEAPYQVDKKPEHSDFVTNFSPGIYFGFVEIYSSLKICDQKENHTPNWCKI